MPIERMIACTVLIQMFDASDGLRMTGDVGGLKYRTHERPITFVKCSDRGYSLMEHHSWIDLRATKQHFSFPLDEIRRVLKPSDDDRTARS